MPVLILAAAGLALLAAVAWRVCRSGRVRHPHHAAGPLASRTYPLA